MRNDLTLFARLYIGCQNREGNIDEFFRQENQTRPPALSDQARSQGVTTGAMPFPIPKSCN